MRPVNERQRYNVKWSLSLAGRIHINVPWESSIFVVWAPDRYASMQTCQPLRILRNHYAFRVSNTPLRKPVENVGKLRILRNFGAIRPIPRTLQQLSWLAVSRKSPAGQNIDKDLFILRLPSHRRQISPSDQQRKLQREVKPCPMKRSADREPF